LSEEKERRYVFSGVVVRFSGKIQKIWSEKTVFSNHAVTLKDQEN